MKQQLDECRTLAIKLFEAGEAEKRRQPKNIWGNQIRTWRELPTESVAVWDAIALCAFDYFGKARRATIVRPVSDCCSAPATAEGSVDTGICPQCHEPCRFVPANRES